MENKILERYELAIQRIREISEEKTTDLVYREYFVNTSKFILQITELYDQILCGDWKSKEIEEKSKINNELYEAIKVGNYTKSYANPGKCISEFGEDIGKVLSVLYAEVRGQIAYVYEKDLECMLITCELFIQVYNCFEQDEIDLQELREIIYWYASDYCDVFMPKYIKSQIDPTESFAKDIILKSDLYANDYLYDFGEFISSNEIQTVEKLRKMSEEELQNIADVIVEGFIVGFKNTGKDIKNKKTVNLQYVIGFELIVKKVIQNFKEIGIDVTMYRSPVSVMTKRNQNKTGYFSTVVNKQYEYDHKDDAAIFLDKKYLERKMTVSKNAYESMKDLASDFAGPVVIEMFGENPFTPQKNYPVVQMSKEQMELVVQYASKNTHMVHEYIKPEERSYTIIAFPTPEIGDAYEEIFEDIIKVNTLDAELYKEVQQKIIDVLDEGEFVTIKGQGLNKTNLTIQLHAIKDKTHETGFENCVADVNIPVGEVFTSPVLTGTNGVLHVSSVYLNELQYHNLEINFKDGKTTSYSCTNFKEEDRNHEYIKENLLYNREWLPMGEFAIGTNTTAYEIANKHDIFDKLPILIAEKMGPHFAIGDTCYSYAEDVKVYNPNGKEIIARDNEISRLRNEDVSKAYFQCHTDITIPYEEIGEITVHTKTGKIATIIEKGEFVLSGTELLNEPLKRIK